MIKLDSNTASILVAILGIIGILAPSIFANYLFNRSDVDITMYPVNNSKQSTIILTNDGLGSATNISLLVTSNHHNFTSITYDKGTVDISFYFLNGTNKYLQLKDPITFNSSFFKIIIQKLVPGLGSKTYLNLNLLEEQNKTDYDVLLTYDQGSTNTFSNEPLNEFFAGIELYKGYYSALFFISLIAITISIIITLSVRNKKIYIKGLKQQLSKIHFTLKYNSFSLEKFIDFIELWDKKEKDVILKHSMNDYILISDLYIELKKRNQIIESYNSQYLNHKCNMLAENALKNIEWTEYYT